MTRRTAHEVSPDLEQPGRAILRWLALGIERKRKDRSKQSCECDAQTKNEINSALHRGSLGQRDHENEILLCLAVAPAQRGIPIPPVKLDLRSRLSYCRLIKWACTWAMKSMDTTTMISSEVPPK